MMSDKKSKPTPAEIEQQAIEQKVDAMMSVDKKSAAAKAAKAAKPAVQTVTAPVEDQSTAPQLPAQMLKTIGSSKTKSTLKIIKDEPDELDEPAKEPEQVAEPEPEATETEEESVPETELTPDDSLEDSDTDKAVDSIMAEEADMQLAVADAVDRQKNADAQPAGPGLMIRFFTSPWTWLFIIGIAGVAYAWYH